MDMRSERIALDKLYKRRDRYEIPDWQRQSVWDVAKKRQLIDSILRGWKLPKFYFQKTSEQPDEYEVVDGQQRLQAIWEFFSDDLILAEETATRFGADRYSGLDDPTSDAFDDYEIEYDEITNATDEEVKEFFQRLQAGLPLTSSEKLNSVHSNLRDFCAKLSGHKFFSETSTAPNRRHGYFDICAKVMTLELEDLDAGLRYDDIRAVFEANAAFSPTSAAAKRVRASLDLLHKAFPPSTSAFRHRSMIQSVITLVTHLQRVGIGESDGKAVKEFLEEFHAELLKQVELGQAATDADFLTFQRTVNANIKSAARVRHDILLRKLFQSHPTLLSTMSEAPALRDALLGDISRSAQECLTLIANANDRYASQHGHDLFKATNKTAAALTSLGQPVEAVERYREWIDDLYFVFRESTGQRLAEKMPPSFADVNSLRTALQHDVDHGSGAAAKRKKLGAVLQRYSGSPTPDGIGATGFLLTQANVLASLRDDLRALVRSIT